MPRGARRNLRPVVTSASQPIVAARRPAAGRPTGSRRAGRGRRPRPASAPIAATGSTRPEEVGTWVAASERGGLAQRRLQRLEVELPVGVVGDDLDLDPGPAPAPAAAAPRRRRWCGWRARGRRARGASRRRRGASRRWRSRPGRCPRRRRRSARPPPRRRPPAAAARRRPPRSRRSRLRARGGRSPRSRWSPLGSAEPAEFRWCSAAPSAPSAVRARSASTSIDEPPPTGSKASVCGALGRSQGIRSISSWIHFLVEWVHLVRTATPQAIENERRLGATSGGSSPPRPASRWSTGRRRRCWRATRSTNWGRRRAPWACWSARPRSSRSSCARSSAASPTATACAGSACSAASRWPSA